MHATFKALTGRGKMLDVPHRENGQTLGEFSGYLDMTREAASSQSSALARDLRALDP